MTLAARFGNPFSKTLVLLGVFGLPLAILGAPATAVTLQPDGLNRCFVAGC
jgi:hypothetical protein